jgi:hypothetical protein
VVGDFNARPGDLCGAAMVPCGPAEMLASGFTDAFAAAGTGPGLTCCQKPELDDPVSQLNRRFDYVFERGFSSVVSAFLVGDQPFETTRPVWPSDHAGVVATVALAPVPEPSAALLFVSAIFVTGVVGVRFRP